MPFRLMSQSPALRTPPLPTPPAVAVEHVLAHALRHLSLMARTSPRS